MTKPFNRILIVEVNWLGDVLFSTPFIRAVRNNFPKAYIACMAVPAVKEALEGNPHINEIICYDERENIRFIKRLKRYNFDAVFLLHRSFTRALLCFLAGIRQRLGYYTFKRAFLLTQRPRPPAGVAHRADYYLGLLAAAGIKDDGKGCDFFIGDEDLSWSDAFLAAAGAAAGRVIAFNPGGNWLPKRWPAENFISLGKKILAYFAPLPVKILITGSLSDAALAEGIAVSIGPGCISAAGKATLRQSSALFSRAGLVVSGDSGPLHFAVAAGAKAIGLYGPTSPAVTGPYRADKDKIVVLRKDVGCKIPCYDAACRTYRCMEAITPEDVFEAVKRLI